MSPTGSRQRLEQEQRLGLRLSQQQVRYVRMLEMSGAEVVQDMRRELDENPALETRQEKELQEPSDTSAPAVLPVAAGSSTRRGEFVQPAAESESLYESLLRQLDTMNLPRQVDIAARYVAGNIDGNGYLRRDLPAIAMDILIAEGTEPSEAEMEGALMAVRGLDPAGVGATDLQSCMELQLERMPRTMVVTDALAIVSRQFDQLARRRFPRLLPMVGNDRARLDEALALLRRLNPKPGAAFGAADAANYVVPDFLIDVDDGEISISLSGNVPELALSASFSQAVADMERRGRDGRDQYVMTRYNDAREYIRILQRRQQTLMDVMTAIADFQKPYLLSRGDESLLRPMALRDVSARSGLDISVISRATRNKYVALPWTTVPLRFFFSESFDAGGSGAEVSGRGVEGAIRAAVENEDKRRPLSDDAICSMLRAQGYDVSRRTVSKYRDRLRIPVARLRAER